MKKSYDRGHVIEARKDFEQRLLCDRTVRDVFMDTDEPCTECKHVQECFFTYTGGVPTKPKREIKALTLEEFYSLSLAELTKKYRCGNTKIYEAAKTKFGVDRKIYNRKAQ